MIRFENVTYTYPFQRQAAVRNINFHVPRGTITVCTGASGCGKSTLARLANGLCPHYYKGFVEGRVLIKGETTVDRSLAWLARHAGSLFQDPEQQFFATNVEDELVFPLEWGNSSREQMRQSLEEAIREFGLSDIIHSELAQLSEGQKQKIGLASIWMQGNSALILDEPTANLDPESAMQLAQKLVELKKRGMAIFIVDHRLYWLRGIADQIVIMENGEICRQGDFNILNDGELRRKYGLRAMEVKDGRPALPEYCGETGIIAVCDLEFAYKNKAPLFENANFALGQGVTAVVGDNGTGKTTLGRILAGLNKTRRGKILFKGQALPEKGRLARSDIVLQNADHQLHMRTVRDELLIFRKMAGKDDSRVDELLELFNLVPLADRHPQSLSGGEKQRLAVAASLIKSPTLLILDEPTSGLDGANMRRLADAIRKESRSDRSILIITHDLELLGLLGEYALRLPFAKRS